MKILIADWDSFGDKDIEEVFARGGHEVFKSPYVESEGEEVCARQIADFKLAIERFGPDCVFSFNYFPPVSNVCQEANVPYLSWVYDSPYMHLYSTSVMNPVNRIFLFDAGMYQILASRGIETVYHLSLGVNTARYNRQCGTPAAPKKPGHIDLTKGRLSLESDISFVGSLYTEERHQLYDMIRPSEYVGGYLEAIIAAQKHVYGADIIEPLHTDEIVEEIQKSFPYAVENDITMTAREFYSQYVLARKVTSIERCEIMEMLGRYSELISNTNPSSKSSDRINTDGSSSTADKHAGTSVNSRKQSLKVLLFTNDIDVHFKNIKNIGAVEYYKEMPDVFRSAKINLNITLRSILTGIPLRALDIMASGGFLLSNYQTELDTGFIAGEEYDYYSDYGELIGKIDYYLSNDKERRAIAAAGWEKIQSEYSMDERVKVMLGYV
ncbi:MAG: glycosyltransferase [Lachnospiraceae bacterium]|nr:glycosyltransferase [Lachnospiraceae bacterium]